MACITGKTIGELTLLTGVTNDTLFAVELSGFTYHIPFSGLNVSGLNYYISGSSPSGVTLNIGDRWFNTNNGVELVYIYDGNTYQWVQPSYYILPQSQNSVLVTTGITNSAATLIYYYNYYGVNYNGDVDLTLPDPTGYDGYIIYVKDEGGYAGTYRIRITSAVGNIDGGSFVDMNINYMSLNFVARNNNWWII